MASLLDGLMQQLSGDTVSQLSQHIGADESSTSSAISMALPVIVSALANNASSDEGAGALFGALQRDHDGGLLDNLGALGSLLGGDTSAASGVSPKALDGASILGHILGGRQDTVQSGIGQATGLSGAQIARLLAALAPIVMAYLGRQTQQQNLDPGGLGSMLSNEKSSIESSHEGMGGLLSSFLDQNHDGSVADDVLKMAPGILGSLFGRKS